MRWRCSLTAFLAVLCIACGSGDAEQDPDNQPSVTVLGTSVDSEQPSPTLGSAVSTER